MPKIPNDDQLRPFWQTKDGVTVKLYQGDVLKVLRKLPSRSVQCVVTSPPYWGLRDYGTGTWEGGDAKCVHSAPAEPKQYVGSDGTLGRNNTNWDNRHGDKRVCKCGAIRTDHQLGSESRPDCLSWARGENCAERDWATGCHVCRMVLVFREVRRVLRDDGTLWLNYGSSYFSGNAFSGDKNPNQSLSSLRVPAYDIDDKVPEGCRDSDSFYRGLCGGCLTALSNRRVRNGLPPLEVASLLARTIRDNAQADCATESLVSSSPSVQQSSTISSSLLSL